MNYFAEWKRQWNEGYRYNYQNVNTSRVLKHCRHLLNVKVFFGRFDAQLPAGDSTIPESQLSRHMFVIGASVYGGGGFACGCPPFRSLQFAKYQSS